MKSRLLLLLVASFLLMGCEEAPSSSESKEESSSITSSESVEESSEEESVEESSEEASSEEESSEESVSSEEESSSKDSSSEYENTKTLDVTFLNNTDFTKGGLDSSSVASDFVNVFNGDTDLLASVSSVGTNLVQITNNDSDACYINQTLQFGSRKSDGELTLSFNHKVVKVNAVVQGYWTAYEYSGSPLTYSVDEYANICIGNEDNYVNLNSEGGAEPEKVEVSYNFDEVYSLKLFNIMDNDNLPDKQGQRAYIHSLSITYIE